MRNIVNDVIVFGKDDEEHNQGLDACLKRLNGNNITLNLPKRKFLKEHLDFFGFQFSKEGKRADPKEVTAFANTPIPSNASLVGMSKLLLTVYTRLCNNYTTIA